MGILRFKIDLLIRWQPPPEVSRVALVKVNGRVVCVRKRNYFQLYLILPPGGPVLPPGRRDIVIHQNPGILV